MYIVGKYFQVFKHNRSHLFVEKLTTIVENISKKCCACELEISVRNSQTVKRASFTLSCHAQKSIITLVDQETKSCDLKEMKIEGGEKVIASTRFQYLF